MSDITNTIESHEHAANVEARAAKATPKPKTRASVVPHSAAIAAFAKAKNIDEVRAGKQFRAVLRANADTYVKNGGKAHTKNSAWADHPRKALKALFPTVKQFQG
jgi:hypothetical protein